jgi:hypothetical protein
MEEGKDGEAKNTQPQAFVAELNTEIWWEGIYCYSS